MLTHFSRHYLILLHATRMILNVAYNPSRKNPFVALRSSSHFPCKISVGNMSAAWIELLDDAQLQWDLSPLHTRSSMFPICQPEQLKQFATGGKLPLMQQLLSNNQKQLG
jgi:hypothetical protein